MTDAEIDALAGERVRKRRERQALREQLQTTGKMLANFGDHLQTRPELIIVPNSPVGFIQGNGQGNSTLRATHTFDWKELTNMEPIAAKLAQLYDLDARIQEIDRLLAG